MKLDEFRERRYHFKLTFVLQVLMVGRDPPTYR
jgi:hypothetical protein